MFQQEGGGGRKDGGRIRWWEGHGRVSRMEWEVGVAKIASGGGTLAWEDNSLEPLQLHRTIRAGKSLLDPS